MVIYGINAVMEALRAGRVVALRAGRRNDQRLQQLLTLAEQQMVPVRRVGDDELDREARGASHQGIVADVGDVRLYELDDLVQAAQAAPPALIVVLDGIEDPHNFGAILRSVDAAGAHGVMRQTPSRRAAQRGGGGRPRPGPLSHVKIAEVVNVARAVEELKEAGSLDGGARRRRVGSRTIRSTSPFLPLSSLAPRARAYGGSCGNAAIFGPQIPMKGHVDSLNVSVAAGVALFEAVRQRREGRAQKTAQT